MSHVTFALNHITAPGLNSRDFIAMAARLGCAAVELRNDLADKGLCDRPFFDDESPADIGVFARSSGVRIAGLSEVYAFNRWSEGIKAKVDRLIGEAQACGAETISLIPSNDGRTESDEARLDGLRDALSRILPMLEGTDLIALVEPLGFTTSSLRRKSEAIAAFEAVNGQSRFRLVHDTFHHSIAGEQAFYPEWTGIVHISGVIDPNLTPEQMRDAHRILVTDADRLGNVVQIAQLCSGGYKGAFSLECFASSVQQSGTIERDIGASLEFIQRSILRAGATGV